jgi:hypothetical protein
MLEARVDPIALEVDGIFGKLFGDKGYISQGVHFSFLILPSIPGAPFVKLALCALASLRLPINNH